MNRLPYSIEQLRALLAAAEYRYSVATWADAGECKRSIHKLRDRLAFALAVRS